MQFIRQILLYARHRFNYHIFRVIRNDANAVCPLVPFPTKATGPVSVPDQCKTVAACRASAGAIRQRKRGARAGFVSEPRRFSENSFRLNRYDEIPNRQQRRGRNRDDLTSHRGGRYWRPIDDNGRCRPCSDPDHAGKLQRRQRG